MTSRSVKYIFICLLIVPVMLLSCNSKKQMILGTWHVVKWENPTRDSFFANARNYIDTIGKGHDDATNIQIYGVANMDSMRLILQKQYDSAQTALQDAANKTTFAFKKDGDVDVTLNGTQVTGKWLLDNDSALIIEEKGFDNPQGISKYKLVDLSDKQLVLKFYDENVTSTVTFEHEAK